MYRKYVIAWFWFNIAFYLTAFMTIVGDGKGYRLSAIIASLVVFVASPFTWVFIKEKVEHIEKAGGYPTLSSRLKPPWSIAAYPMVGFLCLDFLAHFIGEDNVFYGSLMLTCFIFILLSIIAAIYERVRARRVNKLNN